MGFGEISGRDGRIYVTAESTDDVLRAIFTGGLGLEVKDVLSDQGRLDAAFEQLTGGPEEAVKS
ncbi:hypothetical protein D3C75_1191980 [compost metagenome]